MSLGDMISKFNAQANAHQQSQSLNPFSGGFSRSPSPRPSKEEYGKPVAGSKTEERGIRAKSHVCREILELCECIYDVGTYNNQVRKKDEGEDYVDDGTIIVSFGELFEIYTRINDKVVGLLIAAKKKGFVYFEKEILFQRRDDDVLIALIKPIEEIRAILKEAMNPSPSPVPQHDEDTKEQTLS
ncbi:actin-binding Rho-activating protein-like [Cimex lectularius]|uniref:Costars domain-containing protein n=1 Tax=Cimex lectularius TaxID=79782 RepID=A0A8I6S2M8_CIMLE|nr:actin-binding Rho-activating protein-like [Cimex lectularius]